MPIQSRMPFIAIPYSRPHLSVDLENFSLLFLPAPICGLSNFLQNFQHLPELSPPELPTFLTLLTPVQEHFQQHWFRQSFCQWFCHWFPDPGREMPASGPASDIDSDIDSHSGGGNWRWYWQRHWQWHWQPNWRWNWEGYHGRSEWNWGSCSQEDKMLTVSYVR